MDTSEAGIASLQQRRLSRPYQRTESPHLTIYALPHAVIIVLKQRWVHFLLRCLPSVGHAQRFSGFAGADGRTPAAPLPLQKRCSGTTGGRACEQCIAKGLQDTCAPVKTKRAFTGEASSWATASCTPHSNCVASCPGPRRDQAVERALHPMRACSSGSGPRQVSCVS